MAIFSSILVFGTICVSILTIYLVCRHKICKQLLQIRELESEINMLLSEIRQHRLNLGKDRAPPQHKKVQAPKKWSSTFDDARWERERNRNSNIASLNVGTILRRKWKGKLIEVEVADGYYLYGGKRYPTLYAVVVDIAGVRLCPKQKRKDGTRPPGYRQVPAWSATRFFKLNEVVKMQKGMLT